MRSGLWVLVLWAALGCGELDDALDAAQARLVLADEARVELAGRGTAEVGVAAAGRTGLVQYLQNRGG